MVTTTTMVMMMMLMRMTTDPSNDRKSSGESLRGVPVTAGTRKFRHDDDDDQASFLPRQSQNRSARRGQHPPRTLGASSLEQPFSWADGAFVGMEKVDQHEMLVGHGGVQVEAVKTTRSLAQPDYVYFPITPSCPLYANDGTCPPLSASFRRPPETCARAQEREGSSCRSMQW